MTPSPDPTTTPSPMGEALTAEQWEDAIDWAGSRYGWGGSDALVSLSHWNAHAAAALALYGQPFGFTHEELAALEGYRWEWEHNAHPSCDLMLRVLDKIRALLPPAPPSRVSP